MIDREVLFKSMNEIEEITKEEFDELPEKFFDFIDLIERLTLKQALGEGGVIITKEKYDDLLDSEGKLMALIDDGVENWGGYSDAMIEYYESLAARYVEKTETKG